MKLLLLVPALFAAFLPGGVHLGACNEIGCGDGATVSVRNADGKRVGVTAIFGDGGEELECTGPSEAAGGEPPCDRRIHIVEQEITECHEDERNGAGLRGCVGTGRFEKMVRVADVTPSTLRVSVLDGDDVVAERTFEPAYVEWQPNGPDCGPTCRGWSETWEVQP